MMKQGKLIKERVCFAIFAIGVSLAALHEIGCNVQSFNYADTQKQVRIVDSLL